MFVDQPCHFLREAAKVNAIPSAGSLDNKVLLSIVLDKVTSKLLGMSVDAGWMQICFSPTGPAYQKLE